MSFSPRVFRLEKGIMTLSLARMESGQGED